MITKIFTVSEKIDVQRTFLIFTFLISLASGIIAQTVQPTPPPQDDDVVKISTSLIQLDVTVTDRSGKPITDLRADEMEIYENGEKQEITNFSFISSIRQQKVEGGKKQKDPASVAVPVPTRELRPEQIRRTIALVVDDLSLSFESAYQVRRALRRYLDEQMREGDLVAIIRTGAGIGALQQFTSDKQMLNAAIEKVVWNPRGRGGISAFAPIEDIPESIRVEDEEDQKAREDFEDSIDDFRGSIFARGTLGALRYIVNGMGELPGRKSVIFFSDGFTVYSKTEISSTVMDFLRQLVEMANRAAVVFYTIDARGLQYTGVTAADKINPTPGRVGAILSERSGQLFDTQQGLAILAKGTGGLAYYNKNHIYEGVREALDDQSYYLVGYQPDSDTFDPNRRRFNKLEVKVKRPDTLVRYRSGFFNIEDSVIAKRPPANRTQVQQLNHAIASPFAINDISLRLNTLFGNNAQGSFVTSLLHIDARDLKFTEGPEGAKHGVIDILAISFGDNGVPTDTVAKTFTFDIKPAAFEHVLKEGFVCNFTFPVKKPGAYQFRVAVRDSQSDKVGSASQFIQIPDQTKKRLNLSGILLENFDSDQWRSFSGETATLPASAESKTIKPTDPFNDTAIRRFKRGTVLRFGFEAYNAKSDMAGRPNLKSRIRVFRDNNLVMDGQSLPVEFTGQADPRRVKSGGAIALSKDMPPGEYVLQIIVTDDLGKESRKTASQFVQFQIVE